MYKGYKQTFQEGTQQGTPPSDWQDPPPAAHYEPPTPKGTIVPHDDFSSDHIEKTVESLRNSMEGAGTDEYKLIHLLTNHTNDQRQILSKAYKTAFGKDLFEDIKSETSGNFRTCLNALMHPARHYDAICARKAMEGAGTNDSWMIELLCPRTTEELELLKESYRELYPKRDLEKDVRSETSGTYRTLLVSCLTANRQPGDKVDLEKVKIDAKELYDAGEAKLGTDEDTFNRICALRSWSHIREMAKEYRKIAGRELVSSIDREFSFNAKKAFLAIVQYAVDSEKYYTDRIYRAMKDKDFQSLTRFLVSHSETDLALLKARYNKIYERRLDRDINREISGDFKTLLLKILNPKANLAK